MEVVIAVVVVGILLYVMISSRKTGIDTAESQLDRAQEEKSAWGDERFVSYGQVQQTREELNSAIGGSFTGSEEHRSLLKEIVNEWADLRVKTFEERRSWVRSPKKEE